MVCIANVFLYNALYLVVDHFDQILNPLKSLQIQLTVFCRPLGILPAIPLFLYIFAGRTAFTE